MHMISKKRTPLLFFMLVLLCFEFEVHTTALEDPPYKEIPVGVILDLESWVGKTVRSCIAMAVSDFYTVNPHFQTRIVVHNRDTHGDPVNALSAALDLLEKPKVQAIIGSESTTEANFLAVIGDKARVPILSLSPTLSSRKHHYFLQITPDETTQFKAIVAMAESFGWKHAIIICEENDESDSGRDMTTFMINTFHKKNILITYKSLLSTSSSNELLQEELHKLSNMQTKIFITHMSPSLASRLLLNAKHLGMMDEGYKWIITGKTMNFLNLMDDEVIESMQGAVGFKSYFTQSKDIHKFISRWRKESHAKNHVIQVNEIDNHAIWIYDAISALAMAVERIQAIEQVNKPKIKDLKMNGLTEQVLEIINVIDKREKRVGFWTINAAFTKKIGKLNSFSDYGLEAIVWPGGMATNPARRMLQVTKKVLRIGIPSRFRSGGLFQVNLDPRTKTIRVDGFCADVFFTAMDTLSRPVSFEFIPFLSTAEVGKVNYNDLLDLVHAGVFDVAIGDITITANRSLYVDFTLPYTNLGLGVLSRNADASMWIFLKPLSSDLWLVSACFFILLGFVIWILEHRMNEEFQGSPTQQIGTTFWFAFSTIVYAHRQKLESNLSRFVVTIWLFVVLVLVSSYTATLSSLLTVEQIRLVSSGDYIGYRDGSQLEGYIRNLNFKDTRLKPYATSQEYAEALSRGSKNGGVDAIVDEIPYLQEFLALYPSGYSMVVSEVTTGGFGFAFPQGSPLALELSRQISKLREAGTLKKLEEKWFKSGRLLRDPTPKIINLKWCRGLFLISGVSMAVALFIFLMYFIHEKVHYTYTMLIGGRLAFIMSVLKPKTDG